MAVIGTIRNKLGVVLVIFVGLALALFILEGLLSSSGSILSNASNDVASIRGNSVSVQEFEQRVQILADQYKANNNTETLDNSTMDQIREQAWNQFINEMILGEEYEALGLTVGSAELYDMMQGRNIHPQIRQAFTDPKTGIFNPASVQNFIKNFEQVDEATRVQWLGFERSLRDERLQQKYINLIGKSLYVNSLQAKQDHAARNKTARIRFVTEGYGAIADSSVKLSDEEMEEYYEENKARFKQEASRHIEYVSIDVVPSAEDRAEIEKEVNDIYENFKSAKEDSSFVLQNSDTKSEIRYYKKGELPPALDSVIFKASAGTVVGPVLDGGYFKIAKKIQSKTMPDSVKARHILLPVEKPEDKDKVMARMDSIKNAIIKGGQKFEDMARKYSTDRGSAEKGGDLGTFAERTMVKPFNDACFNGKKGDMPIVESQFGIHLIEILNQINPSERALVAIVDRKLEASSDTYHALYAKANDFAASVNGGADFTETITKKGLAKREADVRETDRTLSGFEGSREVVRWAFKAKQNETSKVFETSDKFIVGKVTQIREKGIAPMEQVKDQVTALARKEKKAKMIIEKLSGKISGAATIDAIAQKTQLEARTADNVNFASAGIVAVGREPEVVGTVFGLKPGQISSPLKGNTGVFIVQVEAFTEPAPLPDPKMEKERMMSYLSQRSNYEVYNMLKEKADIKDHRIKFY